MVYMTFEKKNKTIYCLNQGIKVVLTCMYELNSRLRHSQAHQNSKQSASHCRDKLVTQLIFHTCCSLCTQPASQLIGSKIEENIQQYAETLTPLPLGCGPPEREDDDNCAMPSSDNNMSGGKAENPVPGALFTSHWVWPAGTGTADPPWHPLCCVGGVYQVLEGGVVAVAMATITQGGLYHLNMKRDAQKASNWMIPKSFGWHRSYHVWHKPNTAFHSKSIIPTVHGSGSVMTLGFFASSGP